jgi:hypothetical protein
LTGGPGNIGPSGQRQRLVVGIVALAAGCALLLWIDQSGARRWWRIGAFPLVWLGLVGLLQARARTCIALAARGTCDHDAGVTQLTPEQDAHLRRRARTIVRIATTAATILTLVALLL